MMQSRCRWCCVRCRETPQPSLCWHLLLSSLEALEDRDLDHRRSDGRRAINFIRRSTLSLGLLTFALIVMLLVEQVGAMVQEA